jgi:hypothetical protein
VEIAKKETKHNINPKNYGISVRGHLADTASEDRETSVKEASEAALCNNNGFQDI